jgi:signal transduction histidine kinase
MADEAGAADPFRRLRHDLANPLSALLTETQLLLLDEKAMPPEVARGLHEIEGLARRMREILAASRDSR